MLSHQKLLAATSLSLAGLAFSFNAYAQVPPVDTTNTNPGTIIQDLQQKTVPSQLQPDTQRQEAPSSDVEDTQQKPAQDQEMESAPVKKVFIEKIQLEDVTLLEDEDVAKIVSEYEHRDNSFSDLQELTDKLTALYREKGYVTSRIYIPPQKLQGGQLQLKAAEGRMGELQVQDGRWFKARSVKHGFALDKGEPFNADVLKRNLRQLNENPDRNARAVLKPGEHTGETDVELQITDRFPVHLSPSFDNLGRRLIGDNRLGLKLTHNNVLGFGDSALSSVSFTRRSFGLVNHYQIPIGSRGTKIGFDQAFSSLKLGEEFVDANVRGKASTYTGFIMQDILNRERYKLYADLAFDFKQMDTDILGGDFSRDSLRVLRPAINLEEYDRWGRTFMRHEFGIGLDVFGGTSGRDFSSGISRDMAGTKFFRYTGSLIRTQRMPWNTFGVFRVLGQATPDLLVSAEQFQAGGAFTVRGYREGQVIGDNGVIVSAEWRVPSFFFPSTWKIPRTEYTLRDNIQLISFVDYGAVSINRPPVGVDRAEQVLGAGVGLRAKLTQYLTGRLDLAFPLLDQGPDDTGARLHFGVESNIF